MINVFQPTLGADELAAVAEVFDSGWLGKGPRTERFEAAFAEHLGVVRDRLVSVNSCTEAMFLAIELLRIPTGGEVVLPSISFVGAANAVAATGLTPVFCDVDPRSLNPRVEDVAARLSDRTGAVLLLHYGGAPGQVRDIAALCRDRGIPLIEDSACSVASTVDGQACGTFGDLGAWSFDAMKILVTGDGGMLYARDPELARRAVRLAYLGMTKVSGFSQATTADRWWEFEVTEFARRSVTNDLAAAIGLVQLRRLAGFIRRRQQIADHYDTELGEIAGLECPPRLPAGQVSSHWLYWIQLDPAVRDAIARRLYERGVYTTFRYPPLHRMRAYRSTAVLPGADLAAARTLCLPMHQALDDAAVETVVSEVRAAVAAELAVGSRR